jgi:class 3 adenylate cyclase/tetratricopeptide (TPR) repeat protein
MTSLVLSVKCLCDIAGFQSYTRLMAEREVRKTVTVLFADVVSSTALGERLDPEALRRVMGRYFEEARKAVERHGGTVEKFIGDAVMAVFGIPVLHEDDAVRAVRAADELRRSLASLNEDLARDSGVTLQVRIGLNTGEVVAGSGETLVTGDAVNVAKRLEEAAGTGEVFVGEATHRLVRDAVTAEAVERLELKGKVEAIPAFRVLSVHEGIPERARRLESPMVGREREQRLLEHAYERAGGERACHLFTVLGAAGVGKSRLVEEFLEGVGDSATVARGRCLPYGEGITFWPLLEIVRQLHGDDVASGIAQQLAPDEDAELIAERVAAAVGAGGESSGEETFWAARKLFESHAHERPLVLVFDDVQWGEPTFLDLVEHIADWSRDAPILVVCMGRPELLDKRPGWGGGKFNATSVLLEPLDDHDSAELIANLLGRAELAPPVRERVAQAAEGNPLFVEEMLAMLIDDGLLERSNGSWVATGDVTSVAVPPTIQALLAARLDGLAPAERSVAERASVEGKVFHRGAVTELSPAEAREQLGTHLQALVRKELVRPDRAAFPGEDAFRFRHLLIRDAAYEAMPKEMRAELHERFADWLEGAVGERVAEYEEVLGYHLEQAFGYRIELGPRDDRATALGAKGAERLGAAGERALARGDLPAAASLLQRAVDLLSADAPKRPQLLCDLGAALTDLGEYDRAESTLADAKTAAENVREPALAPLAELRQSWIRILKAVATNEETQAEVMKLSRELEELGDEAGVAEASLLLGILLTWRGRHAEAMEALDRAAKLARAVKHDRIAARSGSWLLLGAVWGALPVSDALRLCDRVVSESGEHPYLEGFAAVVRGALHAMAGRWEESRSETEAGWARLADLGQHTTAAATRMAVTQGHLVAGRSAEAEAAMRHAYGVLEPIGEKGYLSTVVAMLAVALCQQGRFEEADPFAKRALELGAEDDQSTQTLARAALAEVLAHRGEVGRAETMASEALELLKGTDFVSDRVLVLMSQALVFKATRRVEKARAAIAEAVELSEEKELAAALPRLDELGADL